MIGSADPAWLTAAQVARRAPFVAVQLKVLVTFGYASREDADTRANAGRGAGARAPSRRQSRPLLALARVACGTNGREHTLEVESASARMNRYERGTRTPTPELVERIGAVLAMQPRIFNNG
jgi:hypothetical protein